MEALKLVRGSSDEALADLIESLTTERDEARRRNRTLTQERLKAYTQKPTFGTFVDLKHGVVGDILQALQDGEISRGKACEALAEIAHGAEPSFARSTAKPLPLEVVPVEEIERLTTERDALAAENLRLFDLVRSQRHELHKQDLISDEEYGWLMNDPRAVGAGSPSPRRLETYDSLKQERDALAEDARGMREALEGGREIAGNAEGPAWGGSLGEHVNGGYFNCHGFTQWTCLGKSPGGTEDVTEEIEAVRRMQAALAIKPTEAEVRARTNAEHAALLMDLLAEPPMHPGRAAAQAHIDWALEKHGYIRHIDPATGTLRLAKIEGGK